MPHGRFDVHLATSCKPAARVDRAVQCPSLVLMQVLDCVNTSEQAHDNCADAGSLEKREQLLKRRRGSDLRCNLLGAALPSEFHQAAAQG